MRIPVNREPWTGYFVWIPTDEDDVNYTCMTAEDVTELETILLALEPSLLKRVSVQKEHIVNIVTTVILATAY